MKDPFGPVWDEFYAQDNPSIPDGTVLRRIETAQFNNKLYQFPAPVLWMLTAA